MVLREEFDADRFEERTVFSRDRGGENRYSLNCSICSERFYTDRSTFDRLMRSIEEGNDNPFLCDECQQEYEEMERTGH